MKKILIRLSLSLLALILSTGIVLALLLVGDKSQGPLEDLMTTVGTGVSRIEHEVIKGKNEKRRAKTLQWADRYRKETGKITRPDTILLGAYDNGALTSFEKIVALEDSLHTGLPIIHFYTAWGSKSDQAFPARQAQAIHDLGSIPLITWEPWLNDFDPALFPAGTDPANPNKGGMKAVAGGAYDVYIDKWARQAKKLEARIFVRMGHEMNDPYRYPWGPQNNTPEDFIAAWRHVVDRFRQQGADNVTWIWSPHPAYTPYDIFYPGDDYVDWVGTTTLNYGAIAAWSQWWSFDEIFAKCYTNLAQYNKPVIITEFSCLSVGGDRAKWFEEALGTLPARYPAVKAVMFFHTANDNTTTYKVLDWSFIHDGPVVASIQRALKTW